MNAKLLDGTLLSNIIKSEIYKQILNLHLDKKPFIAIVTIGENKSSELYIKYKIADCDAVGIGVERIKLSHDVDEDQLLNIINELNNNIKYHGFIIQFPISEHLDKYKILSSINYKKDIDGLTPHNLGLLSLGKPFIIPATALGIKRLLEYHQIPIQGANITIIGSGITAGKPLELLFTYLGATVTVCNEYTNSLSRYTQNADIIISAAGQRHIITDSMVNVNSVVIDVGISWYNKKRYSDVSDNVKDKVAYITPSIGGVGPMTRISLVQNIYNIISKEIVL